MIKKFEKKRRNAELIDTVGYIRHLLGKEQYIPKKLKEVLTVIMFKMKVMMINISNTLH